MNEILFIIELLFSSSLMLYFYKKYKFDGLYFWILVFSMMLGIISQKSVEIFELQINLGFVINTLIFIVSNILTQKKGPGETGKVLTTIVLGNMVLYTFSIISIIFKDSDINQITNISFDQIFYLNNRIYFSSVFSLLISLWLNSILYHQIRLIKNKIIISNTLSTIIIQFIESVLFCALSYIFKIPFINIIELIVIRYIFKVFIGIVGSSIIYSINVIER